MKLNKSSWCISVQSRVVYQMLELIKKLQKSSEKINEI